jgi:hypothetical protein
VRVLSEENNKFLAKATLNGMRRNAYVSEDLHDFCGKGRENHTLMGVLEDDLIWLSRFIGVCIAVKIISIFGFGV